MANGTVVWFDSKKGYGFILPDDGGKELFVHQSDIQMEGFKKLNEGQAVEYEVGENKKGPCAQNVKAVSDPIPKPMQHHVLNTDNTKLKGFGMAYSVIRKLIVSFFIRIGIIKP